MTRSSRERKQIAELGRVPYNDADQANLEARAKMRRLGPIDLAEIAANAECFEAVDMRVVYAYRLKLREGRLIPPIKLWPKNKQDFYVLNDGHHRTLAYFLEGFTAAPAEIDIGGPQFQLSWRWPRIAPVSMTFDLIKNGK